MSEFGEIFSRLERLEQRFERIESRLPKEQVSAPTTTATLDFTPGTAVKEQPSAAQIVAEKPIPKYDDFADDIALANEPKIIPRAELEGRNLLGIIAVVCFALASLLLVKFSIASGWLTPVRQILLAGLIGVVFTLTGFLNNLSDRRYMSQLPATGIVILNLCVYSAVFYHKLLEPMLGLLCISLIGVWSLVLLQFLRRDLFAVLSVVGVFMGAAIFNSSFDQLSRWGLFLIFWSAVFGTFSIWSKRRALLFIAGYLALGLFGLKASDVISAHGMTENLQILVSVIYLQCALFVVFAICTVFYSILHRNKLEFADSWIFFPLILFFYGQIYYFADMIDKNVALGFALGLSALLYVLYKVAKSALTGELASRNFVFSAISLILLHAIYFVRFSDGDRVSVALISGFAALLIQSKSKSYEMSIGEKVVLAVVFLYSYLLVLWGYSTPTTNLLTAWGFGILGILGFVKLTRGQFLELKSSSLPDVVLVLGNIQITTAIWRMKDYISEAAVAPLWMIFAIGLLAWAAHARDTAIARHGLFLVCLAFLRFMIFQFFNMSMGTKIVSLFILGGLVFLCGYLYRYALRRAEERHA
jgi:uncharacterized membrane protein